MSRTFDALREQFRPRLTIGIDEAAMVLRGGSDRAAREAIREAIRNGTILPGLRQIKRPGAKRGRWIVPLAALADFIDGLAPTVPLPEPLPARAETIRRTSAPDTAPVYPRRIARAIAQRERAGQFFQTLRAFMDADAWGSGIGGRPRGGKPV